MAQKYTHRYCYCSFDVWSLSPAVQFCCYLVSTSSVVLLPETQGKLQSAVEGVHLVQYNACQLLPFEDLLPSTG